MKRTNESKLKFWSEHSEACLRSGDNAARYCREQGLSEFQLSYWRKKLHAPVPAKPAGFSKLCAAPAEVATASPRIRVRVTEFTLNSAEDLRALFGSRA